MVFDPSIVSQIFRTKSSLNVREYIVNINTVFVFFSQECWRHSLCPVSMHSINRVLLPATIAVSPKKKKRNEISIKKFR